MKMLDEDIELDQFLNLWFRYAGPQTNGKKITNER